MVPVPYAKQLPAGARAGKTEKLAEISTRYPSDFASLRLSVELLICQEVFCNK